MLANSEVLDPRSLKIVDVFAGVGGLALGWLRWHESCRAQLIAAIDADESLEPVYVRNHPTTKFVRHTFSDPIEGNEARHIIRANDLNKIGVDVLLASPPCQHFSPAGKRMSHPDHRLVFHACDFAEELQPRVVVIENVPEFARAEDGRLLGRVRVQLRDSGYVTHVMHLNAVLAGVPQSRTRCFTIGVHEDACWPGTEYFNRFWSVYQWPWLCTAEAGGPERETAAPRYTSTEDAINDLPPLAAGEGQEVCTLACTPESDYQRYLRDNGDSVFNHVAARHSDKMVAAISQLKAGETPQKHVEHPLRKKDYFRNAYARLSPGEPASTMTTQTHNPGSGRFTHYRDDRVLTVREVARIQSFPDSFCFLGTQSVQRRHVGNAVPPLVSRFFASMLLPLASG